MKFPWELRHIFRKMCEFYQWNCTFSLKHAVIFTTGNTSPLKNYDLSFYLLKRIIFCNVLWKSIKVTPEFLHLITFNVLSFFLRKKVTYVACEAFEYWHTNIFTTYFSTIALILLFRDRVKCLQNSYVIQVLCAFYCFHSFK